MAAVSVHEATEAIRICNYVVSIGVAARWFPTLVGIDKCAESGAFEPDGGLVYKAGQSFAENEFGEVTVENARDGSSIGQPRLHMRQIAVEIGPATIDPVIQVEIWLGN